MTGKELYERWAAALAKQDVGTDGWDDLDETDRIAWNEVAGSL